MGLYSSFYSSLSGLSANANALSVIGNNLANLNTIGYKGSNSSFQDLFAASLGGSSTQGNGNPIQIGLGTQLASVSQNFSQGSFQSSSNVTDMAIQGSGFFTLQNSSGAAAFSRAGNFTIAKDGHLVDPNGNRVMGWNSVNGKVVTNGTASPILLNMSGTTPGAATLNISAVTNLDSAAAIGDVYSTPVQVYDSLGQSHSLIMKYTNVAAGKWTLAVSSDDTPATNVSLPAAFTNPVTFGSNGLLTNPAPAVGPPAVSGNLDLAISGWSNGAAAQTVTWKVYTGNTASVTGYSAASSTASSSQDGFGSGTVSSLTVDQLGNIVGNFTNGQTVAMARVAISTFANPSGMSKSGNNTWTPTLASGLAAVGSADDGGRGTVLGGNLELSNVDVAAEFTQLIVNQRGYQANSRVVTTADSLLQETLNLIR
jgi:flagellar hook protein FlgE